MSVTLSAASCLTWVAALTGARDEAALLDEIDARDRPSEEGLFFLPYLSGERTPHNDPGATGAFVGLRHEHDRADLGRAVLEGVAFALADGQRALTLAGAEITEVSVIGGGARSRLWGQILAAALDRPLVYRSGAAVGPALGAARLGRLALGEDTPEAVCTKPPVAFAIEVDPVLRDLTTERIETFRALYPRLRGKQ
jgi:xylulokinase